MPRKPRVEYPGAIYHVMSRVKTEPINAYPQAAVNKCWAKSVPKPNTACVTDYSFVAMIA